MNTKSSAWETDKTTPGMENSICEVPKMRGSLACWVSESSAERLEPRERAQIGERCDCDDRQETNHEGLVSHLKETVLYSADNMESLKGFKCKCYMVRSLRMIILYSIEIAVETAWRWSNQLD